MIHFFHLFFSSLIFQDLELYSPLDYIDYIIRDKVTRVSLEWKPQNLLTGAWGDLYGYFAFE